MRRAGSRLSEVTEPHRKKTEISRLPEPDSEEEEELDEEEDPCDVRDDCRVRFCEALLNSSFCGKSQEIREKRLTLATVAAAPVRVTVAQRLQKRRQ